MARRRRAYRSVEPPCVLHLVVGVVPAAPPKGTKPQMPRQAPFHVIPFPCVVLDPALALCSLLPFRIASRLTNRGREKKRLFGSSLLLRRAHWAGLVTATCPKGAFITATSNLCAPRRRSFISWRFLSNPMRTPKRGTRSLLPSAVPELFRGWSGSNRPSWSERLTH